MPLIKIAPSILSANFAALQEDVSAVENAGAEYLHIDVMDGHFVPNITIGPLVVQALRARSSMCFDVHLMVENPDFFIDSFITAGADLVTVHVESVRHLHRTITTIKEKGCRVGVALNPATPPDTIEYVLPLLDLVLLMTVNPGFGGQGFIPLVLPKIRTVRDMVNRLGLKTEIQVDGGINRDNAATVVQAGADVLVAGSAIFNKRDIGAAVRQLREAAAAGL
ncbi:MAG: ribulose-phosphate 3-epimerase [Peptococcaceae bacterium]|nr:ribulose-phosphate 3-epimerase [Candidatus Syntrophopropionicum ammoniitolerans]